MTATSKNEFSELADEHSGTIHRPIKVNPVDVNKPSIYILILILNLIWKNLNLSLVVM